MPFQVIPLDDSPNQTWQVSLNINGGITTLFVELNFNEIAGYWAMSIFDINQTLLASGVPLLTGLNLLEQ
jgi:hypothetical protein